MQMKAPQISTARLGENLFVAEKLREVADLLDQQGATQFRIAAYRDAAAYVASLPQPIRSIYTVSYTHLTLPTTPYV